MDTKQNPLVDKSVVTHKPVIDQRIRAKSSLDLDKERAADEGMFAGKGDDEPLSGPASKGGPVSKSNPADHAQNGPNSKPIPSTTRTGQKPQKA